MWTTGISDKWTAMRFYPIDEMEMNAEQVSGDWAWDELDDTIEL